MRSHDQRGSRLLATLLALILTASILYPAAIVLHTTIHGAIANLNPAQPNPQTGGSVLETLPPLSLAPSIPLLTQTFAWALGIAIISTVLAWPAAWLIRARGWGIVGLLCIPL